MDLSGKDEQGCFGYVLNVFFEMLGNYTTTNISFLSWIYTNEQYNMFQAQKQVEYQNNINTKIAWNFKSLSTISSYWYITLDDLQMQYYIIHQISFLSLHIGAKVVQKSLHKKKYIYRWKYDLIKVLSPLLIWLAWEQRMKMPWCFLIVINPIFLANGTR